MVMPEVLAERRKARVWRFYISLDHSKEILEVFGTYLVIKSLK